MIKYILIPFIVLFLFTACGGGGSSSSSNSITTITATLIDSKISGVSYSCANKNGLTDENGQFFCEKGSMVSFFIGGIELGSTIVNSNEEFITPAKLYGLSENNITDTRLLNFIQLVQSLDNDGDPSNGIEITQNTRNSFNGYSLDLSDDTLTQTDINNAVISIGKNLKSKSDALEHYIDTLTNTLNINLEPEPYYSQQWYLDYSSTIYTDNNINENAHINVRGLLNTYTGKGIKIAIIDDGFDTLHEDLEDAIVNSYDITSKTEDVSHSNSNDYHGTAVTGIIAARLNAKGIHGIASNSDIILLKHKEGMSDSETIELFNKAEEFGADIINCSWGTYDVSQSVKEKIQDLAINGRNGKGTIIVFASGNDDQDMGNDESAIPEVIAVGSTDKDNLRAWYSNYGANLDVLAPGGYDIGITTLDPMNTNGVSSIDDNYLLYDDYSSFIGTSSSAPIVSGAIALLLEKDSTLTRLEIENILKNTSDKIGNIPYENGKNDYYGYGKINLYNILNH